MNYTFKNGAATTDVYPDHLEFGFSSIKISDITGIAYKPAGGIMPGLMTIHIGTKIKSFGFSKKDNLIARELYDEIAPLVISKLKEENPEALRFWDDFNALPYKDLFGTRKEVNHLPNIIHKGERIKAVTSGLMDGNTWLIACTSERVIFLDLGMIYGLKQMEIPLDKINSINQKQGLLLGEIHIQDGATNRKIENVDKSTINYFIDTVNEQRNILTTKPTESIAQISVADELLKFKQLLDIGAINQDEFETKKKQLLGL